MINGNRLSAVLVSTDLEAAQRFYEEKVGLTLSPETIPNHLRVLFHWLPISSSSNQ